MKLKRAFDANNASTGYWLSEDGRFCIYRPYIPLRGDKKAAREQGRWRVNAFRFSETCAADDSWLLSLGIGGSIEFPTRRAALEALALALAGVGA